jgi:transcriptional regulator with XRE-family HTH domain
VARKRFDAHRRVLGHRLVVARVAQGLSQAEVAEKLGYPQSYVSRCERGQRRIDAFELAEFADLYGTTITALSAPPTPEELLIVGRARSLPRGD